MPEISLQQSSDTYRSAQDHQVLACQTHRRFDFMRDRGYPLYADRAEGARFTDIDGNTYLDYLMSFGPIVLGHNDPAVTAAVHEQIARGTVYTLGHPLELEVADLLIDTIPSAEMVGFFLGGSSATSGAVRIARAYTGRDRVVKCGYHGWHDWTRPNDPGVPAAVSALTDVVDYGDLDRLEAILLANDGDVACVVLETIQGGGPPDGYLQGVIDAARRHGALSVFDETKVGFRVAFGGAGEHFGVTPDLSTFGKAISNGYPGSFLTGTREVLASDAVGALWMTGTFQSDLLSLAAISTTVAEMTRRDGIATQWRLGDRLIAGLNDAFGRAGLSFRLVGCGPMPTPVVDDEDSDRCFDILRRCLSSGHYLHPTHPWFLSLAHTEADVDATIAAVDTAIRQA